MAYTNKAPSLKVQLFEEYVSDDKADSKFDVNTYIVSKRVNNKIRTIRVYENQRRFFNRFENKPFRTLDQAAISAYELKSNKKKK
jgi:hypothetical protein